MNDVFILFEIFYGVFNFSHLCSYSFFICYSMSLKAGGVALNLTVANHIYLMDPWWNPAAEMQAIDRTHRLGQYRPIRAVRFIAENTVEERILQLQEKKRLVFDGTVGRDASSLKMLTVDDMKSLFS